VQSSGLAALDTASSVSIALHVNRSNVLYGAISGDRTGNALGRRVHVGVSIRIVELVGLTANSGCLDVAVGCGQGGGAEKGESNLHDGLLFETDEILVKVMGVTN
jgi:hypothetical protein